MEEKRIFMKIVKENDDFKKLTIDEKLDFLFYEIEYLKKELKAVARTAKFGAMGGLGS
jgi:hypothetical protein